jgi:hypothetical protein
VSDIARNYIKSLPKSRVTSAQKNLLKTVADYHNIYHGCAWPGNETIAEDMNVSVRYVRKLLQQCIDRKIIEYTPGLGAGNLGAFVFVELKQKALSFPQKEEHKEEQKGEQNDSAIRKNLEPGTSNENHHASGALTFWLYLKDKIKSELSSEEWNLWVRPLYFLKELDHKVLLLAMPPNSRIMQAASKRKQWLREKFAEFGYSLGFTRYPDEYELKLCIERTSAPGRISEWQEVYDRVMRKKEPQSVSA